jgi:hypothetical protein
MKRKRKARPPGTPGPATNRRKANKPIAPAKARRFHERGAALACPVDDPGPEDVSEVDS